VGEGELISTFSARHSSRMARFSFIKKLLPLIGRSYQMHMIAAKHGCDDHIAIFLMPRD
jgi:hypothetical protein